VHVSIRRQVSWPRWCSEGFPPTATLLPSCSSIGSSSPWTLVRRRPFLLQYRLLLALDAWVAALLQVSLVSGDVASFRSSLVASRSSVLTAHLTPNSLLYPGLIPVKSVSYMLLSVGAKREPRSGLEGEGCLLWSQLGALRIYCNIQNYRVKLMVRLNFENPFHNACPS